MLFGGPVRCTVTTALVPRKFSRTSKNTLANSSWLSLSLNTNSTLSLPLIPDSASALMKLPPSTLRILTSIFSSNSSCGSSRGTNITSNRLVPAGITTLPPKSSKSVIELAEPVTFRLTTTSRTGPVGTTAPPGLIPAP